jgi:signal transduction histidine kinase
LTSIRVDPAQLERVIVNLAVNARDAMPGGRGTLTFRTEDRELGPQQARDLSPGAYLVISVEDDGGGIAPAVLRRVFEPLYTTKPHGNGLGLSTAHGIVRSHGGEIAIESEPGRGTTVRVFLPADR